jgi:hypothetical protein
MEKFSLRFRSSSLRFQASGISKMDMPTCEQSVRSSDTSCVVLFSRTQHLFVSSVPATNQRRDLAVTIRVLVLPVVAQPQTKSSLEVPAHGVPIACINSVLCRPSHEKAAASVLSGVESSLEVALARAGQGVSTNCYTAASRDTQTTLCLDWITL